MQIAIMSDSHDHLSNLRRALQRIRELKAGLIVHCGDFVAPFVLAELANAEIPVHGVFGNNDGDQYLLTKLSLTSLSNITLHGLVGRVDVEGFTVGFTHQRVVARGLAAEGDFDLVCYGHSHAFRQERVGDTLLLNPGDMMGKDGRPGFCIVETLSAQVTRLDL